MIGFNRGFVNAIMPSIALWFLLAWAAWAIIKLIGG